MVIHLSECYNCSQLYYFQISEGCCPKCTCPLIVQYETDFEFESDGELDPVLVRKLLDEYRLKKNPQEDESD